MKLRFILPGVLLGLISFQFIACKENHQTEALAQTELQKLGKIDFPTTCSDAAQKHFLTGVAALHSFWYPVALKEFQASTKIDPNCMMGYWGEAMAHNHPIWGDPQETDAARKVIEKIKMNDQLTEIERAWISAVKILYAEGEKPDRDKAYAKAMEALHQKYPDDVEAALFYALAQMGAISHEDPSGEQTRLHAGEIASKIFQQYPNHPGAAHYVLHAYDDPKHAKLALSAAQRYSQIAPAAPHALHMPSHIFLQLGMWPEAAASNEESWAASERWVKSKKLPAGQLDFHSLHWLGYVYLQQGEYKKTEELITKMRENVNHIAPDDFRGSTYGKMTLGSLAAAYGVEAERWDDIDNILPPPQIDDGDKEKLNPLKVYTAIANIPSVFGHGMAEAARKSSDVHKKVEWLRSIQERTVDAKEPFVKEAVRVAEIQALEIQAMSELAKNNLDTAVKIMKEATTLENATPPPPGPPTIIKPSYELFGEILLRAGRPQDAEQQFEISLQRHRNRARSLLGMARAATQIGDTEKGAKYYAAFVQQWKSADSQLTELQEAKKFTGQLKQ
jgi:tetratricopeptide (TPR) repeat protein